MAIAQRADPMSFKPQAYIGWTMPRLAYLVIGVLLLLMGFSKFAGLFYLLATGLDSPASFLLKQVTYTIGFVGGGVALLSTARKRRQGRDDMDDA